MPFLRIKLPSAHKIFLFACIVLLLSACAKNDSSNSAIKEKLQVADSLYFAGNNDSALKVLKYIRSHISTNDPLISSYYSALADNFFSNPVKRILYADSALRFFSSQSRIKKSPDIYYNALLTKGDACLKIGKYIYALSYYYRAKNMLAIVNCDNGELAGKMASIYFGQQNYALAGKYWGQSYNQLGLCDVKFTPEKLFFLKQGALNNAGFAYQRAGLLDSADYYYQKDLSFIDEVESDSLGRNHYFAFSRAVLYDNLGGLNLALGNITKAKDYLYKSIKLYNNFDKDGSLIPPYIKLAQLYMRVGDLAEADSAFSKSKILLNRFGKDNSESLLAWDKLYSEYLLSKKDAAGAYHYQESYIRLKDSFDHGLTTLYRLDVERELNGIQQREAIEDFKQNDNLRRVAITGSIIIVSLFVIILVLVNRSLKKTKRNHRIATLQNEQLQHTLSELERVNKNYIRIMRVMAHDLRNPISGMTGLATLLQDEDALTDDSKHMLRLIETTGIHSLEMINELLKTGLADDNEKIQFESLDITSLLFDSIELLQFKANDKQQQIVFDSNETPITAEVNHEKIWRVINNLIVNAIKFSHTGGVIKVGIKRNVGHLLISVADNGIGIPADQKESVFEMFTPAKKAGTDGEQPFGLGLSISKRIVEMHNGRIWFENNIGTGTIFFVELPYRQV